MANDSKSATRGDVKEIVNEIVQQATDAILKGMDNIAAELHQDHIQLKERIDQRIDTLEAKVDSGFAHTKDQIDGLKADLSDTHFVLFCEEASIQV